MREALTIKDLCEQAHATAVSNKYYVNPASFIEKVAMVQTQLAKAIEQYRLNHGVKEWRLETSDNVPVGVPIELASSIIRIADLCENFGVDLEGAIRVKMAYNAKKPAKDGKKAI